MVNRYMQETGNSVQSKLDSLNSYNWDMFLSPQEPRPDIDINYLIKNIWSVEYDGPALHDRLFPQIRSHSLMRFQPVFFYDSKTGQLMPNSSFLLAVEMYFKNDETGDSYTNKDLTYSLWLAPSDDGKTFFTNTIPFQTDPEPDRGGEKRVIVTDDSKNRFITASYATAYDYAFQKGSSPDDFWLNEFEFSKPTGWRAHFRRVRS